MKQVIKDHREEGSNLCKKKIKEDRVQKRTLIPFGGAQNKYHVR